MFTGIVQGIAPIHSVIEKTNFKTHVIKMPQELLTDLEIGASVAHNGVCLTVTKIDKDLVSFDLMTETLRVTNLGSLREGDYVNIERAMRMGTEIGGHILSGHIYCTAKVAQIIPSENNLQIRFELPQTDVMKYILHKGFIAVDGISLTVGEVKGRQFSVNIEIDPQTQAVVDAVERYLTARSVE